LETEIHIKTIKKKSMRKLLLGISTFLLVSCGANIKSSFTEKLKPLTIENKVAFLDIENKVPENAKKIGTAKYGDSGFSTDCGFDTNLISARNLARTNGANIVKVIKKSTPDLWSSCYRITVEFYYVDGDVTKLPQYQIQIN
jgi:hypothetical protein